MRRCLYRIGMPLSGRVEWCGVRSSLNRSVAAQRQNERLWRLGLHDIVILALRSPYIPALDRMRARRIAKAEGDVCP
jgi:hypothetical protein